MSFGIATSTFAPAIALTVWWKRLTKQGIITGMWVGLAVSLLFTFARFFKLKTLFGLPVLVNPALYSIPIALIAFILVSMATKEKGKVEEFMAIAHCKK